jgi:ATP-dependent RNA helicase RhlB
MLFSATLTEDVLRLASQWMPDPVIVEIEPEQVAVDTVLQKVYAVPSREKFALLYNLLQQDEMKRVLVFGNRKDRTQRLAAKLRSHDVSCALLSGLVPQKKRLRILNDFREGKVPVLVATDVAGRGIHVEGVTHVINYEFPYEPEDYVHRIGRTGRAGCEGTAISFACEDESFIVPEIEAYIGKPLPCELPAAELLARPPRPTRPAESEARPRDSRRGSGGGSGRDRRRSRRSSGGRSGSGQDRRGRGGRRRSAG